MKLEGKKEEGLSAEGRVRRLQRGEEGKEEEGLERASKKVDRGEQYRRGRGKRVLWTGDRSLGRFIPPTPNPFRFRPAPP